MTTPLPVDDILARIESGSLSPADGASLIRSLRADGEVMALVEDWVDDAPVAGTDVTGWHVLLVCDDDAPQSDALLSDRVGEVTLTSASKAAEELTQLVRLSRTPDAVVWLGTHGPQTVVDLTSLVGAAHEAMDEFRLVFVGGEASTVQGIWGCAIGAWARSVALEWSGFHARVTCGGDPQQVMATELALVKDTLGVEESRWSGDGRCSPRLAEIPLTLNGRTPPLVPGGVYVITGGTGGVGRHVTEWVARAGGLAVVVSRSGVPTDWLSAFGGAVTSVVADLGDRDGVARALAKARELGPVRGVIHAAGVLHDSLVWEKSAADITEVVTTKACAGLWLDEATADDPLDFFVAFSAVAGLRGNLGQSDYAYANRVLDALVQWRADHSDHPGASLSIAWPLWADGGMRPGPAAERYMRRTGGLSSLETGEGLAVLGSLLDAAPNPTIAILKGDRRKISDRFMEPPGENAPEQPTAVRSAGSATIAESVEHDVARAIVTTMRVPLDQIDRSSEFVEFGFDSITFTELASWLNERWALELLPSVFYDHATVGSFVDFVGGCFGDEIADHRGWRGVEPVHTVQTNDLVHMNDQVHTNGETFAQPAPAALDVARPSAPEAAADEPIAVVGLAGRFPGGDIESFWESLRSGRVLTSEVPAWRWDWRAWHGATGSGHRTDVRFGGFIEGVENFDCQFFGISPAEADLMDPQQRLFLEAVWSAVEDSGHRISELAGTSASLFVGVGGSDYAELLRADGVGMMAHAATGSAHSVLANRVSYLFDLRGASEPIDTACSASLVAIHRAVQALRNRDSDVAIAGGVNVLCSPTGFVAFSEAGMLSPDGLCKAFDEHADGYVRGEGVGAVVLKRLSQARADHDHIYGLVVGTAVGHGGRGVSLTAPSARSQSEVIDAAWRDAGVPITTADYIESHGTGTRLGDPVEIEGLDHAFRQHDHDFSKHCAIGSVKANVGHLETAAGIASLAKVLLSLRDDTIAPHPTLETVSPLLRLDSTAFTIPTRPQPWPSHEDGTPRRAGISSFGYGGVNAHIVVEEPPTRVATRTSSHAEVVTLSAKDADRLRRYAQSVREHIAAHPELSLTDLARTLQEGREPMPERLAIVASDLEQVGTALDSFLTDDLVPGVHRGTVGREDSLAKRLSASGSSTALIDHLVASGAWDDLASCWTHGLDVDWADAQFDHDFQRVSLPTYPFAAERHWLPEPLAVPPCEEQPAVSWLRPVWRPAAGGRIAVKGDVLVVIGGEEWPVEADQWRTVVRIPGNGPHGTESIPSSGTIDVLDLSALDGTHAAEEPDPVDTLVQLSAFFVSLSGRRDLSELRFVRTHARRGGGADPANAATAAFLRSFAQEEPRFRARTVEVSDAWQIADLLEEFGERDGFEVRRDGQRRSTRCLVQDSSVASSGSGPNAATFRRGGVYVITGGGRGLGAHVARHVAETSQAHLVLMARSSLPEDGLLDSIRALGATVEYASCDVCEASAVTALMEEVIARHGRIDGVIHCAGTLRDGFVRNLDRADIEAVLGPKAEGTRNIDLATRGAGREFLLLFSSSVGVVGNAGQSNYAYANAFLAHYAQQRRAEGDRTVRVVHWPLWAGGGMGVDAARMQDLARLGGERLPVATGLGALTGALISDEPELLCAYGTPTSYATLVDLFDSPDRAWAQRDTPSVGVGGTSTLPLPIESPAPDSRSDPPANSGAIAAGVGPAESASDTAERLLRAILSQEMRLAPENIAPGVPLAELGMDSMVVRGLNRGLMQALGQVPSTLAYEHPTLAQMVDYLVRFHGDALGALARERPAPGQEGTTPATKGASSSADDDVPRPEVPAGRPLLPDPARARSGDIAVIGMDGRYPGADDLDEFWDLLVAGRSAIREVPLDRWDAHALLDENPENARGGRSYGRWGGFLDGVERFDPKFFGISPRDAETLDPQERLFLETSWHTFEAAGYPPSRLRTSRDEVGVFAGVTTYTNQMWAPEQWAAESGVNPQSASWSLANRVSFIMDLRGPSMTVDTACAASLSAVHLACEALRNGSCRMALAGGVNLYMHPARYITLAQARMLSPTGRCSSFGQDADGFVPGEGVGAVLLKPLADALEDGDNVVAVIKGTATNHGGRTNGYTVPNPAAQSNVIRAALETGGVDPGSIGCIEAHGTGTVLGDPIELAALKNVVGAPAGNLGAVSLGSVKSNIGHLEGAAGIAGLTKVILELRHQTLVPTLNCTPVNPRLDFDDTRIELQTAASEWQAPTSMVAGELVEGPRRAGISSFGAGGTNVHVVVEEFTSDAPQDCAGPQIVVLSARTPEQLSRYCAALADHLRARRGTLSAREDDNRLGRLVTAAARVLGVSEDAIDPEATLGEQGLDIVGLTTLLTDVGAPRSGSLPNVSLDSSLLELVDVTDLGGRHRSDLRLIDVAHTLRVGREPMGERIGFVVSTLAELLTELDAAANRENAWSTRPTQRRGDRPDDADVDLAIDQEDWAELARLWVMGATIDWGRVPLGQGARTVELPTYPFERVDCRFPRSRTGVVHQSDAAVSAVHDADEDRRLAPLLGTNTSSLTDTRFTTVLRSDEPHLADHVVVGDPTLPGAAVLEMARAGGTLASGEPVRAISDVLWARPIQATDRTTSVDLSLTASDNAIRFAVTGHGADQATEYCRGRVHVSRQPEDMGERVDPDALLRRMHRTLPAEDCYRSLDDAGLHYGPTFRGLREIHCGSQMALSRWEIPSGGGTGNDTLDPSIIDAAFQTVLGLSDSDDVGGVWVPFALSRLTWSGKLPGSGWVQVVRCPDARVRKVDIVVTDDGGNPVVRIDGLTLRQFAIAAPVVPDHAPGNRVSQGEVGHVVFGPDWRKKPASGVAQVGPSETRTLLVDASPPLERLVLESGVAYQNVDATGAYHALRDAVADRRIQRLVMVHDGASADVRALAAMARTVRAEQPRLRASAVQVGDGVAPDALLNEIRGGADDAEVRLQQSDREVLGWAGFILDESTDFRARHDASYLITGGLGGLGRRFAEFLAARGAGRVVLAGRRALDPQAAAWLDSLGCAAEYRALDVSDRASVRELVQTLRDSERPPLRGILHAAGVLRDGLLAIKDSGAWDEVCAPKVTGTVVLDEETADMDLDWFGCFSSLAGAVGNPGQCEYAYANRFMDAYMSDRERLRASGQRSGRSLSIGWPLWSDGGMGLDDEAVARLERTVGTVPMATEVGQRLFGPLLAAGRPWVGVLNGHRERVTEVMGLSGRAVETDDAAAPSHRDMEARLVDICADILKYPPSEIDPTEDIHDYGLDSIGLMTLMNCVEEAFSTTVDPGEFSQLTTLAMMARHLEDRGVGRPVMPDRPSAAPQPSVDPGRDVAQTPEVPHDVDRVAVIGMAARLPGSRTVEEYWRHLQSGDCLVRQMPRDRFDVNQLYSADRSAAGRTYSKHGGFLDDDIFAFDPDWFGIGEEDAMVMDPHHRLVLELSVELLHEAGYRPEEFAGSKTGVYLGGGESNYLKVQLSQLSSSMMRRAVVNTIPNMAAARVSDFLDLRGPSQMIDTACSSALVALHQACAGLRAGDCDTAIVGGVELLTDGQVHIGFSKAGALAADGVCRVFDADADGMVPGEGAGLVLLKPYRAAVRDGDTIHAVILGSAVNNDGHTIGLTVPDLHGQQDVVASALAAAGVRASDISYLEAHGTGTSLGDPIEIQAASRVFTADGAERQQCGVGSVKSNIGHLLRAAGIAGLIKVILALRHGQIPPTLNCPNPHPRFRFSESPFYPVSELVPWPGDAAHPRRAGVSAFGFGGTNAHAVLEAADPDLPTRQSLAPPRFNRRHLKVGDPVGAAKPSDLAVGDLEAVLDKIEAGQLSPEAASVLLGANPASAEPWERNPRA